MTESVDNDPVLSRAADVLAVALEGEVVVMHGDVVHRLNPFAAAVWERVDGVTSVGSLIEDLRTTFVDREVRIDTDVRTLVTAMLESGIIEVVDG